MKSGLFIAFEGLDGAGSTTQAYLLEQYLKQKNKVLLTKEPTQNIIGGIIRAVLKGDLKLSSQTLQLLFAADRANHLEKEILPALKKGFIVISDRYLFSSVAYGASAGLDREWLLKINEKFRMPDITIFLDVKPETCIKRISESRFNFELFEQEEKLRKVREEYLALAEKFSFKVINGEGSIKATHKKVLEIIKKYF
ncbi:MAG: dTMP kinase [Candidatus Micrarchaeota archaeon]